MGVGDEILAAGQAQRLVDEHGGRVVICDIRGQHRWHPIWDGNPILVRPETYISLTERIHFLISSPHARPYIIYPFTEQTGWTFNPAFHARDHIAKIYLTEAELALGVDTRRRHGDYVLIEPWSKHPNLRWPWSSWEGLVVTLRAQGRTVVQHLSKDSHHVVPGAVPIATLTFREACGVLASASVYVRGESGMCHAAAALGVPNVVIWGGCMDWEVLGGYPRQVGVGVTPPWCGRYLACPHCAATMAGISVQKVIEGIERTGIE